MTIGYRKSNYGRVKEGRLEAAIAVGLSEERPCGCD
jgi:hypothetical protein